MGVPGAISLYAIPAPQFKHINISVIANYHIDIHTKLRAT